ncbi:MAG: hypothetical protein M1115_08065 [Actinobacteria bacterium]|nr:hypothetical protein [Actinomycetota bacterium]
MDTTSTESHEPPFGFSLRRAVFAEAVRDEVSGLETSGDAICLEDFSDSTSAAIGYLVRLAQSCGAVQAPEDLRCLDLEIAVYSCDDEYSSNLLIAVRPGPVQAGVLFGDCQVATALSDTNAYGPRDGSGAREVGIEALTGCVLDVLDDANSLLALMRAAIAGSKRAAAGSDKDGAALDQIAHILCDPEWGVGMLEDIAHILTQSGRSLENRSSERTWERH